MPPKQRITREMILERSFAMFCQEGMAAVNADTIRKNTRSQHVLEKVGFRFVGEDETFKYYRIEQ